LVSDFLCERVFKGAIHGVQILKTSPAEQAQSMREAFFNYQSSMMLYGVQHTMNMVTIATVILRVCILARYRFAELDLRNLDPASQNDKSISALRV